MKDVNKRRLTAASQLTHILYVAVRRVERCEEWSTTGTRERVGLCPFGGRNAAAADSYLSLPETASHKRSASRFLSLVHQRGRRGIPLFHGFKDPSSRAVGVFRVPQCGPRRNRTLPPPEVSRRATQKHFVGRRCKARPQIIRVDQVTVLYDERFQACRTNECRERAHASDVGQVGYVTVAKVFNSVRATH